MDRPSFRAPGAGVAEDGPGPRGGPTEEGSRPGGSPAGGSPAGGSPAGGSPAGGSPAGGSVAGGSPAVGSVAGGSRPDPAGAVADEGRVARRISLPSRPGVTAAWPEWVDPRVRAAYEARGIVEPWRHQVVTAEHAWAGRHVIVATATASGKSAAFGMPALTAALEPPPRPGRRGPTVLYISPTKALAHDQLAGLSALGIPGLRAAAVDGDSPDEQRRWARSHARWVVTNPDMLHRGILPAHETWQPFLRDLRFIVVDEAHTYRGVFGAHVALVLRRLRRVAARLGAAPTLIAASATIADPATTAAHLLGADVEVVDVDDSAHGPVEVLLWAPTAGAHPQPAQGQRTPPLDVPMATARSTRTPAQGTPSPGAPTLAGPSGADPLPDDRVGPETPGGTLSEAADLMGRLVDRGVHTLTFARSRRAVEILSARVRERAVDGHLVRAYRGGYLPEERRALEEDLRSGRLRGLAATNALELGIDVSGLDAVVLAGWPGSRSSFWQQVGRAGRRGSAALAVLIPREDPLDRYIVEHPEVLTGRSVEASVLDPANPYVLAGHLCAAAAEAPLLDADTAGWFGPTAVALCEALAERGMLRRRRAGWYWTDPSRPADLVDLRGSAGGPVRVVEDGTGRLLGTVDPTQAPASVHEGALYVHQGATFEVLDLDLTARVATAAPTVTDLSTHARSVSDVAIESVRDHRPWQDVTVSFGEVVITNEVTSYLVRRWPSGQVLGEHPLDLPRSTLQTAAMWWTIPDQVLAEADVGPAAVPGAVHALEHAAIGILPLLATCDRWDLGGVSTAQHGQTGAATIVVHDAYPGGAGFAERGYHRAEEWLTATATAIGSCPCPDGCPSCVQSPKCGNGNEPLDKGAALRLARTLLARALLART